MDPNETLRKLRKAREELARLQRDHPNDPSYLSAYEEALGDIVDAAGDLDDWIGKGGFLPKAWMRLPDAGTVVILSDEEMETLTALRNGTAKVQVVPGKGRCSHTAKDGAGHCGEMSCPNYAGRFMYSDDEPEKDDLGVQVRRGF
jgi:hypothetical protein